MDDVDYYTKTIDQLQTLLEVGERNRRDLIARILACPSIEARFTQGPRKAWDGEPDLSKEGWVELDWERFDYIEQRIWIRGRGNG